MKHKYLNDKLELEMKDIPDMFKPLNYLPLVLRKKIMKSIPKFLKLKKIPLSSW